MAAAAPHVVTAPGNFVVVTQVISSPQSVRPNPPQDTKSRNQIQASVLGTLQIAIGVSFLMVQLASMFSSLTLGFISGAVAWAPLSFIVSGSLTLSSEIGSKISVSCSQHFSLLSVLTSCAAGVISALDVANDHQTINHGYNCSCYCEFFPFWSLPQSLSVVLALFCLAEVIVATLSYLSSFHTRKQNQITTNHQPQEGAPERTGTLPTYEAPPTNPSVYEVLPDDTPTYVTPIESPPDAPPPNSHKTVKPNEYNMTPPLALRPHLLVPRQPIKTMYLKITVKL